MKKKSKILKVTVITIVILILSALLIVYFKVPIKINSHDPEFPEELPADSVLSAEQVAKDRNSLISKVESIHPYFILEKEQSGYDDAKNKYERDTEKFMSVSEFQLVTSEYLSFFEDGHTTTWWQEDTYLDIDWEYSESGFHLLEDGKLSETYITSIGGVSVKNICNLIDKIYPAENEMATIVNYNNYAKGKNLLKTAGVLAENNCINVTFSNGDTKQYAFNKVLGNNENSNVTITNQAYMQDDIFVVDFNVCEDDDNLKAIATNLEKAIANGTTKVIIDARGNGGGNSNACERLLRACGMEPPSYSICLRYSPEAQEQNGYLRNFGKLYSKGSSVAKKNGKVDLVVLCDRYTFSSATMLLVYVRDGKLGKIIGEPSANMPSSYGDIIYFSLDNSHLCGTISHKRFIRPNGDTSEKMLIPDIQTSSDDAFDAALEYFKK